MIASLLRLFALRPLFTVAILGIPIIVLIVVGLAAILLFKLLIWVALPLALGIWLWRSVTRQKYHEHAEPVEPAVTT